MLWVDKPATAGQNLHDDQWLKKAVARDMQSQAHAEKLVCALLLRIHMCTVSPARVDSSVLQWHVQGMTSALRRNGAPAHGLAPIDPISLDDPDLVAYWTFDEGQGYRVKDVTNKGHDLTLTQHPRWQVRCLSLS